MQLSENIYSVFRKDHLYGKCGDIVTVISKHGDVVVVEGPDRKRYPVEWAKLEPEPPSKPKKEEVKHEQKTPNPQQVVKPISKPTGSRKKKPATVINQKDLFQ